MRREIIIWWVWVIGPFLRHPIATIKGWLKPDEAITPEELAALTPQEREALK